MKVLSVLIMCFFLSGCCFKYVGLWNGAWDRCFRKREAKATCEERGSKLEILLYDTYICKDGFKGKIEDK